MRFKRWLSFGVALLLLCAVCGCAGDYKNKNIYFELTDLPDTLDPQTAASDSELLVVKNLFEGLLRKDASGNIIPGVAEKYETAGLTYTFHLRQDAHWFTGEELTAAEFVFAFRRAVDPATKAPFAERLWAVENAFQIIAGKQSPEQLGISAPDAHTLIIRLSAPDSSFPDTLTTSVCMPCQQKFFEESGGKYGLSKKNILTNGSYYLAKWERENFGIRLYRNAEYHGSVPAQNAAVFLSRLSEETPLQRLKKNTVDAAFLTGNELQEAQHAGIGIASCEDTCWVLTVGAGFRGDIGDALAMMIDPNIYAEQLPPGLRVADTLLPSLFTPLGITAVPRPAGYDPQTAKQLFARGLGKIKDRKFPQTTLYYYGDASKDTVTAIVGHWQNGLSAYINIEAVSSIDKLLPQLENQTLPLAYFPVKANGCSLREYLLKYGVDLNKTTPELAQQNILSGNRIIPIAFGNTSVGYTGAITNFSLSDGTGYLDFAPLIKKG